MLVLFFPTQWGLWKSHDTLWQSPTYSNALSITPYLCPCMQPKPSLFWSPCGFSKHYTGVCLTLTFPFLKTLTLCFWLAAHFSPVSIPITSPLERFFVFTVSEIDWSLSLWLFLLLFSWYYLSLFDIIFYFFGSLVYCSSPPLESDLLGDRKSYSPLYPHCPERFLVYKRCSVSMCWIDGWINEQMRFWSLKLKSWIALLSKIIFWTLKWGQNFLCFQNTMTIKQNYVCRRISNP